MNPQVESRSGVTRCLQSDGSLLLLGASRSFRITRLKPGAILVTGSGSLREDSDREAEAAMLLELSAEIHRSGEIVVFADSRATPRISSQSAQAMSRWMRDNERNVVMSHMLVSSKLVEMAIAVVGMANRSHRLKTYRSPAVFLAAIREVVSGFSSLPSTAAAAIKA